jgi:hypothetical protein
VQDIIKTEGLDIPDSVIDRAHRVGKAKDGTTAAPMLVKFTTWRHRTMLYKARKSIKVKHGINISLDITKANIELMDLMRLEAKREGAAQMDYVFCDVNCQPTIKLMSGKFCRFDTAYQGKKILGLDN